MKRWFFVLPGLLLLGAASTRWGMFYNTGFETPNYQAGQPINGQDDWEGVLTPDASPDAAIIVENPRLACSGRRAIMCKTSDLDLYAPWPIFYLGLWRRPIELDAVTIPAEVRVEADVRLDGPYTGPDDLVSANLYARNGPGRSAWFYLSANGNAYANSYRREDPNAPPTMYEHYFETPINVGVYNKLAITLNYITQLATFEVNNKTIGQLPFGGPGQQFTDVMLELAPYTEDHVSTTYPGQYPTYDPFAFTAYWDNIRVRSKPAH